MAPSEDPTRPGPASEDPTILPEQEAAPTTTPEPAQGPDHLGDYRILGVLGQGGMGKVYLAEQQSPKRTVALKVIRPGWATPALLRRFEHEAEVLGRLQHPGIAQVYEAGVHDDRGERVPFFAMECVRGRSLVEFAEQERLGIPERLELFAQVCDAVQHAHTKGVIHRDLKPGNIIVPDDGRPRVLDFGVARVTDADVNSRTMCTVAGELVGTVPYMSPEQIAGDAAELDTRSDVYALGVVLYELLTGKLPHDVRHSSIAHAARVIGEQEPAASPASTASSAATSKPSSARPSRRTATDATRAPATSPRTSDASSATSPSWPAPPSAGYQLRKFARRNKPVVAGAAAVVISLVLGVLGTSWQAVAATSQSERAQREAANATASMQILVGMLEAANPEESVGREPTVRETLDATAASIDELAQGNAVVEATVRNTIGTVYQSLGQFETAEAMLREAARLFENADGPRAPTTLTARRNLGGALIDLGRLDDAEALITETSAIAEADLGPDAAETIASIGDLARIHEERGELEPAEAALRRALDRARPALGEDDPQTLTLLHNLATNLKSQGRLAEAEPMARESLQNRRRVFGEKHPQTLYSMNNLATILVRIGQPDEAEQLLRDCYRLRTEVLGPEHPSTMTAAQNLANILVTSGRLDEAEPLLQESLRVWERELGQNHPRTLVAMNSLAYLLEERGKLDEAEALYRRVVDLTAQSVGRNHPEAFGPLNNLAMLLKAKKHHDEAMALFDELLASARAVLPADHYFLGIFGGNAGECLLEAGRYPEAEQRLLEAERLLRAALGDDHPRTAKAVQRIVDLYERWGRDELASQWRQAGG